MTRAYTFEVGGERLLPSELPLLSAPKKPLWSCEGKEQKVGHFLKGKSIPEVFSSEATSLLKWKSTLHYKNDSLLASWTQNSSECRDWNGVKCSNGRVNSLDITNASVIDTLYDFPFSTLIFLEYVNLSINHFSGIIPLEIGKLTNLVRLDLSNNYISGTIPPQIDSLTKLGTFHISMNQLNGSIPKEIGYLRSLTRLALNTNLLEGSIPTSLGNLNNLTYLCLYGNRLSGSIPVEIGKLVNLIETYLGSNQLAGHIPPEIGNLINVRVFSASSNEISGPIPVEIAKMQTLELLDLSDNLLEGEIPEQLVSLSNLVWLDLSYNRLTGCIPQGRQFSTFGENSYAFQSNIGLHGYPVTRRCHNKGVEEGNDTSSLLDQEINSQFLIEWKAVLLGYGCGLCVGFSIGYFMISTGNPKWLSNFIEEYEHTITTQRRKKQQGQRDNRRRNNQQSQRDNNRRNNHTSKKYLKSGLSI
uniref:Leucine-rich repeat-containing N-terminal plant-type domain-containing protein n=1 Tax=Solanum lycopersicum TaxID=4081 RepID=K4BXW6_SOLLC